MAQGPVTRTAPSSPQQLPTVAAEEGRKSALRHFHHHPNTSLWDLWFEDRKGCIHLQARVCSNGTKLWGVGREHTCTVILGSRTLLPPAQHLQQLVKLLMNFCNHLANPGGSLEIHFSYFCHSRRLLETQNRICPGPLQPLLHRGESGSLQTLGTALAQTDRTKGEKHSAQCSLFYPFSSNSAPLPLT